MEHQYSTFHGTSNRDNYRTVQWNSSEPGLHLKNDVSFYSCIDHGVRSNSLLGNCNYQKAILLNLKMSYVLDDLFFSVTKDIVLFKIISKA